MTQYSEIEFLAVIVQDDFGEPSDAANAGLYASHYNFNFATVPDPSGFWQGLMGPSAGFPTNMLVDLETMQLLYVRSGLMQSGDIQALLDSFLN